MKPRRSFNPIDELVEKIKGTAEWLKEWPKEWSIQILVTACLISLAVLIFYIYSH